MNIETLGLRLGKARKKFMEIEMRDQRRLKSSHWHQKKLCRLSVFWEREGFSVYVCWTVDAIFFRLGCLLLSNGVSVHFLPVLPTKRLERLDDRVLRINWDFSLLEFERGMKLKSSFMAGPYPKKPTSHLSTLYSIVPFRRRGSIIQHTSFIWPYTFAKIWGVSIIGINT